jgi:hypothetical protein
VSPTVFVSLATVIALVSSPLIRFGGWPYGVDLHRLRRVRRGSHNREGHKWVNIELEGWCFKGHYRCWSSLVAKPEFDWFQHRSDVHLALRLVLIDYEISWARYGGGHWFTLLCSMLGCKDSLDSSLFRRQEVTIKAQLVQDGSLMGMVLPLHWKLKLDDMIEAPL